jgi:hypothetical protein
MRLGLPLALTIVATAPALAQPAPPAPPAQPPADALASFEKELDALFTGGGLTADQAAALAPAASPSVRKAAAQIDIAVAQAETAELVRVPRVGAPC